MGELINSAKQYAQDERQRLVAQEARDQQEEAERAARRETAHRRAVEFVDLLEAHDIPKIKLINGEQVLALGWLAISNFEPLMDQDAGLFISEDASMTVLTGPGDSMFDGKIQPTYAMSGVYADEILSEDWTVRSLGKKLVELKIVQ